MRSSIEKNSAKEDVQNDFPCIRCVFLVQEFICLGHDRKFLMWTIVIFYVTKKSVHLVEKLVQPIEEDRSIKGGGLEAESQPVSIFVRSEVSFCHLFFYFLHDFAL